MISLPLGWSGRLADREPHLNIVSCHYDVLFGLQDYSKEEEDEELNYHRNSKAQK